MKFSEKWLREWVDPTVSTGQLSHQLTMAGLEVDAVDPVAGEFDGVVVGHVLKVEPHPDADRLRVCQVDIGGDEPLSIVCGAPNVHEGMRAPTATVGARLPGGLKIKQSKLRGVPSFGMLCSVKELGLAESAEGLMPLPSDAPVGQDLREYLGLDDVSIELGLTPNRGDCLSVAGVAREVAVLNRCSLSGPEIPEVAPLCEATFPVEIEAPGACPRYVGRVVRGVDQSAPTPLWMQERLRRSGLRSLGPLVDVTNYVLLELGQPMHAFDLARLDGGIRVRMAAAGERITLLNGNEAELDADTLVIADGRGPQALAGIMGGESTSVTDATRDIFLESAFFAPMAIIGRARRYGLHTDSSHRFERGVSPQLQRLAIERATALLCGICGGEPGPVVDLCIEERLPAREPVALRAERLARVLGASVPRDEVGDILRRLGMEVTETEAGWQALPPPFRFDLAIEVDLIEEVARIYGYSSLPTRRLSGELELRPRPEAVVALTRLRETLVERGYQEAVTYSFVEPGLQALLDPQHQAIPLANPISADMSVMRTSLWPGLVQALRNNLNRQQERVRLFESGLTFRNDEGGTIQEPMLAGAVFGPVEPEQWGTDSRPIDFFDVKGDLEALHGISAEWRYRNETHPVLHPGQSARLERAGVPVGWLGALHPRLQKQLDIPGNLFLFEIHLDALCQRDIPSFNELSRFPAIRRDIAVIVEREVSAEALLECASRAAPATLRELMLFDVYQGEHVDPKRKSIALGLTLQDDSRTLTDSEVDAAVAVVVGALGGELGASLRE